MAGASGEVDPVFTFAALDCPSGIATIEAGGSKNVHVLGRLTGQVLAPVQAGEPQVVMAWPIGVDGRKRYGAVAIFGDGELRAVGEALWIEVRDPDSFGAPLRARRPRCAAGKPARDVAAVGLVVLAEALDEPRLLDEREPDRVQREERGGPNEQRRRPEQGRLAHDHRQHAHDHRVAHEPVGATDHQLGVGSHGASVPSPSRANRAIVRYIRARPAPISAAPRIAGQDLQRAVEPPADLEVRRRQDERRYPDDAEARQQSDRAHVPPHRS